MSAQVKDDEVRQVVVQLLKGKGYNVRDISSGSGVPKFSRVEISKGPRTLICAVKTSTSGRICFTRNDDGSFKVLSSTDRVIHAKRLPGEDQKLRISMFDSAIVTKAFDENYRALAARGMGHIPLWVNPEHEDSTRMTGSGFQGTAQWSEIAPIGTARDDDADSVEVTDMEAAPISTPELGIMDRIKAMLSEHLGVRPEFIEIDVRVKL